jgi:hypothetical protein
MLPTVVDREEGVSDMVEEVSDVPVSFDHGRRSFRVREVSHIWVDPPGLPRRTDGAHGFDLLGGE